MRKILNALMIASCLFFTSCGTGRIATLDRKAKEAIIVAKIQIKNGDSFIGNKWNLLLDERLLAKWAVWPDENNYIYMKVPVGEHFVALLQYNGLHKNIPDKYLTIDVKDNGIYYIGDIVIHWPINPKTDAANYAGGGALGGALGAVADSKQAGEYLKVDVVDNYDETTAYFISKFKYDQIINKSLLRIKK
jgi:hypothetical protein